MNKKENPPDNPLHFASMTKRVFLILQCFFVFGALLWHDFVIIWAIVLLFILFLDTAISERLDLRHDPLSKKSRWFLWTLQAACVLLPTGIAWLLARNLPALEGPLLYGNVFVLAAIEAELLRILWNTSHIIKQAKS